MIACDSVTFKYRHTTSPVIRNGSCQLQDGGIVAIVGESGVGKSTLIALIAGIYVRGDPAVEVLTGEISVDGGQPKDLRGPSTISWVPQETRLLDHLTVYDNIMLPARVEGRNSVDEARCLGLLKALGIKHCASKRPRELSVGMQSRACLARGLITKPKYLFLDEPFTSVDIYNRLHIYAVLLSERTDHGMTTVMTTHNVPEAMLLANEVVVMLDEPAGTRFQIFPNDRKMAPGSPPSPVTELLAAARVAAQPIEELIAQARRGEGKVDDAIQAGARVVPCAS